MSTDNKDLSTEKFGERVELNENYICGKGGCELIEELLSTEEKELQDIEYKINIDKLSINIQIDTQKLDNKGRFKLLDKILEIVNNGY